MSPDPSVKIRPLDAAGELSKPGKVGLPSGGGASRSQSQVPNLRIVYLSSRIYAGYASTPLNPEPYAYESAFSVRWLIQDQIRGKPELNYDPARAEAKSPLLLWGPYLWGDGLTPRKTDGLVWERKDLSQRDGTHPGDPSGREKVAQMLLKFFKTDPTARLWFTEGDAAAKAPGPTTSKSVRRS